MNRVVQFFATQRNSEKLTAISEPRLTDLGNAQRLVSHYGQDLRFCHSWGKWLVWDGTRWRVDDTAEVVRKAKNTVKQIYVEAATADEEERKAIAAHAMRSESGSRIRAMISLAESEPGITVTSDQLDAERYLLNVRNGTLDLRVGTLHPHRQEDLITKLAPVHYDPIAACPQWERFLDTVMGGKQDMIDFLQRAVGYALTVETSEECLFILHGEGSNGKSTFLETVRALLGDYAQQAEFSTFLHRNRDGVRNDVARMCGARFVSAVEAQEGRRLAESLIKQMTGQDTMTARFLFREHFEFKPQHKLFLAANHKPEIRGTDRAIWRRIHLIPFNVIIPNEKQDKGLFRKLRAELPGILAWATRGCLKWQHDGLGVPEEVKTATEAYRSEMDVIASFIDECCAVEPDAMVVATELYMAYRQWCSRMGEEARTQNKFGRCLSERGFRREKNTLGYIVWHGIGLRNRG